MIEKTAGEEIVERLERYHQVKGSTDLGEKMGKGKQHINSMRKRERRDVNYDVIMHLLDEVEHLKKELEQCQRS